MHGKKKAQIATEYFTTYVYAGVAIVAVVGALAYFGAFDKGAYTKESCESGNQIDCRGALITTEGRLSVMIENKLGRPVTITEAVAQHDGQQYRHAGDDITLLPNENADITFTTNRLFKENSKESFTYNITFKPYGSPNDYTVHGSAVTKVELASLVTSECGNSVAEAYEACDGTDFKSKTCSDMRVVQGNNIIYPYVGAGLRCVNECTKIDASECDLNTDVCAQENWRVDGWAQGVYCCQEEYGWHVVDLAYADSVSSYFSGTSSGPVCCALNHNCAYNGACYDDGEGLDIDNDGTNDAWCWEGTVTDEYEWVACGTDQHCSAAGAGFVCAGDAATGKTCQQGEQPGCAEDDDCDGYPFETCELGGCEPVCDDHHYATLLSIGPSIEGLHGEDFDAPEYVACCYEEGRCAVIHDPGYPSYECAPSGTAYVLPQTGEPEYCLDGTWVDCGDDSHCPSGQGCDPDTHNCVGCLTVDDFSEYECGTWPDGCGGYVIKECYAGECDANECFIPPEDFQGAYSFDIPGDDTGNIEEFEITSGSVDDGAGIDGGSALVLDGVDSHVDLGNWSIEGDEITLAAWVKLDYYPFNEVGEPEDPRVISKGPHRNYQNWALLVQRNKYPEFRIGGPSGSYPPQDINQVNPSNMYDWRNSSIDWEIDTGRWYHLAGTYDGATMKLYLNGSLLARNAYSGTLRVDELHPVWIGGQPVDATEREWPGVIDELYILNRALTADEIRLLYESMV
ncbi:LamG domain-containing protein [Candidatus Woesearchaeota archaeon]|nr:LamG domain-containing protein [Candidatus Woesearchaeota archaeon]